MNRPNDRSDTNSVPTSYLVAVLIHDQRFVYFFRSDQVGQVLAAIAADADNPDLPLNWDHAMSLRDAVLSQVSNAVAEDYSADPRPEAERSQQGSLED